jgi:hypothetical protein
MSMPDMILETEAGEIVAVGVRTGGIALTVENENGRRVNLLSVRDVEKLGHMLAVASREEAEANA